MIKKWKLRRFCRFHSKVHDEEGDASHPVEKEFIEREREKPTLGDFTLGEYTEKVVVYGFLMVGSWLGQRIVASLLAVYDSCFLRRTCLFPTTAFSTQIK